MPEPAFRDLEHAGWHAKANAYDDLFAKITDQAITPILESLSPLTDKRLLDVACGTGHLVCAAASLKTTSEGVDFAPAMVSRAKYLNPVAIEALK